MYVYTYVFKYVYIYIYVCIHIYIYTSAPTRLERGNLNANLSRCADLKQRLTSTWGQFANLKKSPTSKVCDLEKLRWLELEFFVCDLEKVRWLELDFFFHVSPPDLWSQRLLQMVLDTHPPRSPWSHWVWVMVPTHIKISILIHGFIDRSTTVDIDGRERIRSISTVDHSLRIAVDRGSRIKYRDNLWSILSTTPVY